MSKKRLLFVIEGMGVGGAEKALVSLLNYIDYNKYEVDLQLFFKRGINLKFVPDEVNILPALVANETVSGMKKLKKDIKDGRFFYLLKKLSRLFVLRVIQRRTVREGRALQWKSEIPDMKRKNTKYYDVAVGYMQGPPTYYVHDCINAAKKYCWVHIEYNEKLKCIGEEEYFKAFDKVLTVSPVCVEALKKCFPSLENIALMYNMNSPMLIKKLSEEYVPEEFGGVNKLKLVSVGRLCHQKGFDIAIDAARLLRDRGYSFTWLVIGRGPDREVLLEKIRLNKLEDCFSLIGIRENPYVYLKNADIVLQTSRFEGKSIVIDEAKILNKPIVCTSYNSVYDQLCDNETAVLTEINAQGIADGIIRVIEDKGLRESLIDNLSHTDASDSQYRVLEAHYELFDA